MKLVRLAFTFLFIAGPIVAYPDDLEDALKNLKDAELKKDPEPLKKAAMEAYAVVRRELGTSAPEDPAEEEFWRTRTAYAHNVELQTDYALYVVAAQAPPAGTIELLGTLEQLNPKSKYLDEGYGRYFVALTQTGSASRIPAIAEKAVAHFPENEDLLLVLANDALNKRQIDRQLRYSERLVATVSRHPRPEGYSVADWEKKRRAALARGYWMCGIAHSEKQQFYEADKDLRAALPLIPGGDASQAAALFHLGLANFQIGKMTMNKPRVLEAVRFSEQAAAFKGPYAEQAWRNAQIIKAEAAKMR